MRLPISVLMLGLLALITTSCATPVPASQPPGTTSHVPTPTRQPATPTEAATPAQNPAVPTRTHGANTGPSLSPADTPPPLARDQFSTDFDKHSVPYTEIRSGGPPKDGIPAIDEPKFVAVEDADEWLGDQEAIVLLDINGDARAYPVQILMFHEIVNDTVGGEPISVTYCPLCNAGIAFERRFDGGVLDFGTTGYLRNSNLVMYDRQTESWWQQATGEGIAGEFTGRQLEFVPAALVSWTEFKAGHPGGQVLSRQTGFAKPYGLNPYSGYDSSAGPFLFDGPTASKVLPLFARVLTIELEGEAVAYAFDRLREARVVNDTVAGVPVVIFWAPGTASPLDSVATAEGTDVGAATAFKRRLGGELLSFAFDGERNLDEQSASEWSMLGQAVSGPKVGQQLEPVVAVNHFWFDWYAFQPETRVWQAGDAPSR